MDWQDVLRLKTELDALGVRIFAIEHPNETQWRVRAGIPGAHRFTITDLAAWHAALDAGEVPGITRREWDAAVQRLTAWAQQEVAL